MAEATAIVVVEEAVADEAVAEEMDAEEMDAEEDVGVEGEEAGTVASMSKTKQLSHRCKARGCRNQNHEKIHRCMQHALSSGGQYHHPAFNPNEFSQIDEV